MGRRAGFVAALLAPAALALPAAASAATSVTVAATPAQALVQGTVVVTVASDDADLQHLFVYARKDDGRACEPTARDFTDAPANQAPAAYAVELFLPLFVAGQQRYEARFTPWAEHRPAVRICAYANAGLTWETRGVGELVLPVGPGITAPGPCPAGTAPSSAPRIALPPQVVVGRAFRVSAEVPGTVAAVLGPAGPARKTGDGWDVTAPAPGPATVTVRYHPTDAAVCTLDAVASTTAVTGAPLRLGKRRSLGYLASDRRGRLLVPLPDGFALTDLAASGVCRAAPLTVTLRYALGLRRAPGARSRTLTATRPDGCDGGAVTARGKGARILLRGLGARIRHREPMRAWVQIRHGGALLQEARYAVLRRKGAYVALSEGGFRKARCGDKPKALRRWKLPRCA